MPLELERDQMTEFLMEIKTGKRIVTLKDKILVLQVPNIQVMNDAGIIFSKVLATLLAAGVPSRAKSQQLLKEQIKAMGSDADLLHKRDKVLQQIQEAISDSDGEDIIAASKSIGDFTKLVTTATNKVLSVDNAAILEQASSLEYMEMELLSSCAEARAEAERDLYVLYRCVFNSDGTSHWPSFDIIHEEIDMELLQQAQTELLRLKQGMPSAFEMIPISETVTDSVNLKNV